MKRYKVSRKNDNPYSLFFVIYDLPEIIPLLQDCGFIIEKHYSDTVQGNEEMILQFKLHWHNDEYDIKFVEII